MSVIMVLVDNRNNLRGINNRYSMLACMIDKPVVPGAASDSEGGQVLVELPGKDKIINTGDSMKFPGDSKVTAQVYLPVLFGEFQGCLQMRFTSSPSCNHFIPISIYA